MFVIVYKNNVILGPMNWNRFRFEDIILEDCDVNTTLPSRNDSYTVIEVSPEIRILPVQHTANPEFNPSIEILHGPFWNFTDTHAVMSYQPVPMTVDAAKNQLKSKLADLRWQRENTSIKVNIQNVTVTVDISRTVRDTMIQKYLLMSDTDVINWKFPETWINLTKSDLHHVVGILTQHVQAQFDWEMNKVSEIDTCTNLNDLSNVILE